MRSVISTTFFSILHKNHNKILCGKLSLVLVRTQFVTTHNNIGFARKKAQTISFIERGFERLSLGHRTGVSRDVYTELNRVRLRSLSP